MPIAQQIAMQDFLLVKSVGEYLKIPFSEVVYIESLNKYVKIVTNKTSYLITTTMCNIEKLLPYSIFRRVHRSYVVSFYHVKKFDFNLVYLESRTLPIGKHYKQSLLQDVIILSSDEKQPVKLNGKNVNKLLRNINPQ